MHEASLAQSYSLPPCARLCVRLHPGKEARAPGQTSLLSIPSGEETSQSTGRQASPGLVFHVL